MGIYNSAIRNVLLISEVLKVLSFLSLMLTVIDIELGIFVIALVGDLVVDMAKTIFTI